MELEKKKINEQINFYKKEIEINNNNYISYYHLAKILYQNRQLEESIYYLNKCLNINPKFEKARIEIKNARKEKKDLITYLSYYNPSVKTSNFIIKCNQKLKKIEYNLDFEKKITNEFIISILNQIKIIIETEILDTDFNKSQIYRESIAKYDCKRHFEVFNTFRVIPKNCFSCYKVQIQPTNVLELIKVYFLFNKIHKKINLTRKCMTELRKNVSGHYKAFIYCVGLKEANETLNILNPILNKTIGKNIPRIIKRGCSEYSIMFPHYKEINPNNKNFMKYDPNWKIKENIVDERISKRQSEVFTKENIIQNGISLNDALIINNWLAYAKKNGDKTYKSINYFTLNSKYIKSKLS